MASSLTHRYFPRIEQHEENLFMEEYFSSTDTKIYMDNEEQTEIAYIQYVIQEQLKPIYGYSSRTWDDVAIGNRIVTGTFKVPIKNDEKQSTMEEIINKSNGTFSIDYSNEIEEYNNEQNNNLNQNDWYQGPTDDATPNTNPDNENEVSDRDSEYISKLIQLGYDLDYNSTKQDLTEVLKTYQRKNNLDVNGKLTMNTAYMIDEEVENTLMKTRTIPARTKLYLGPSQTFDYTISNSSLVVYILDDESYENNWSYVMTMDGRKVFINV